MVRTEAPFPSDQLVDTAKAIARAESRVYPTCVRFDSALVKLATPGASPESLRGQFSSVDLDKMRGQFEIPEGDALAFPPVTAAFAHQATGGRNGRLLLPYVLTTTEWNHYIQKQTIPERFQKVNPQDFQYLPQFNYDLIDAIQAAATTSCRAATPILPSHCVAS